MDDFTYLEYIKDVSTHHNGKHVLVKCTLCDNEKVVSEYHFRKKNVKSCGCLSSLKPNKDYTGETVNGILLFGYIGGNKYKVVYGCGHIGESTVSQIKNKAHNSCKECTREVMSKVLVKRNTTHGLSRTRTNTSWLSMKRRCYETTNNRYKHYGERGIKVCEKWMESFDNFLSDMGECPDGMSIDRIDLHGDYCKDNCKWSTDKEQANNKSNNILVERISTGEVMSLKHWSDLLKGNYKRNHWNFRYKSWTIEKILGSDFKLIQP